MFVITLTDCPQGLRGDLTKWLFEINTGVYVGRLSARVRELVWKRVCDSLKTGRATMVYAAANEQRMSFRVHNTTWEPVDFDGLTMMRRPVVGAHSEAYGTDDAPMSSAEKNLRLQRIRAAQAKRAHDEGYVVIDIETTGLDSLNDSIIEIAAIRIVDHQVVSQMDTLVNISSALPANVAELTGITADMLRTQGIPLKDAVEQFKAFIGNSPMIGHHISFDRAFLNAACKEVNSSPLRNICKDTLTLARRYVQGLTDYQLETVAKHLRIPVHASHRALVDCMTTFNVYKKLNEL